MKGVCMIKYMKIIQNSLKTIMGTGFSAQHCLLAMTEKWRKYLDKNGVSGALLTDLSII